MLKKARGKNFVDNVLNSTFWKECVVIVQVIEPLVCVLCIVDSDDRSTMGYLYAVMHKAWEEMIRRFQRRKKRIEPYFRIVESHWDKQLHKNLHANGYWLIPNNQFNVTKITKHKQTISGFLGVIERYSYGNPTLQSKLTSEMKLFRNAKGNFGPKLAINDREVMLPSKNTTLIFWLVVFS